MQHETVAHVTGSVSKPAAQTVRNVGKCRAVRYNSEKNLFQQAFGIQENSQVSYHFIIF